MLMPTGSLLMTSPTATSSLLLGFATYFFLGGGAFFGGVTVFGTGVSEYLGARDQVDVEVVEDREGLMTDREYEEASDTLGDAVLWEGRATPEERRGGTLVEGVMLVVRCRDANVEPGTRGPDKERFDETFDS